MGGIERAFMSTTSDRNVAMEYAAGHNARPKCSMLFQIRMGMIDRGADIAWASQFPNEAEILFAPLTGLEVVARPWVEGKTIVVELRLTCNLSDHTIDKVIAKMKRSHT